MKRAANAVASAAPPAFHAQLHAVRGSWWPSKNFAAAANAACIARSTRGSAAAAMTRFSRMPRDATMA